MAVIYMGKPVQIKFDLFATEISYSSGKVILFSLKPLFIMVVKFFVSWKQISLLRSASDNDLCNHQQ